MSSMSSSNKPPLRSPQLKSYYAIVLHDFTPERADELDAKSGDAITVVAQSNREWFVAKPIGRLGRPGLIPVSFVELRDSTTGKPIPNVKRLIDCGELPRVEEWKNAELSYKKNSIPLGVFHDQTTATATNRASGSPDQTTATATNSASHPTNPPITLQVQGATPLPEQSNTISPRPPSPALLPEGILLSAVIRSYHYEADDYWFRIHAVYQPYGDSSARSLPPAKELVLFRCYNDFYDFQVELLSNFPYEAGRADTDEAGHTVTDNSTRILPYMPGPVEVVDNEITMSRREELDEYLQKLCGLKSRARYILEHALVRSFCSLRPGDGEVNVEPRWGEMESLQRTYEERRDSADTSAVADRMSRLRVSQRDSDASRYEEDPYYGQSNGKVSSLRSQSWTHQRTESSNSLRALDRSYSPSHSHSYSRTHSPVPGRLDGVPQSRTSLESDGQEVNARSSLASDRSPVSMQSSSTAATSVSGRLRSASNAISQQNPNPAFVKIKIFDRVSDDLVAIRVHPMVTLRQLIDKVQARLGSAVPSLRYRDSLSNEFVTLDSDGELRDWLESTDRHVLYAE